MPSVLPASRSTPVIPPRTPVRHMAPVPEDAPPTAKNSTTTDALVVQDLFRDAEPDSVGPSSGGLAARDLPADASDEKGPSLSEGEARLSTLAEGRYESVARALAELSRKAAGIADGFQDPTVRLQCIRVLTEELPPRLERLAVALHAPEPDMVADWVEPDLLPILNGVSELYSLAVRESRRNASARPTAALLRDVLYGELSAACSAAGWFDLQVVDPYETDFDPAEHFAIGSEQAPSASGKVVDVRQVGRRSCRDGMALAPAHVVVGR